MTLTVSFYTMGITLFPVVYGNLFFIGRRLLVELFSDFFNDEFDNNRGYYSNYRF